jgi:hypothetical protein
MPDRSDRRYPAPAPRVAPAAGQTLDLGNTKVTNDGLKELAELQRAQRLVQCVPRANTEKREFATQS